MTIVGQFAWVSQLTSGVPPGACGSFARLGIIAFVERFELEIGLDVTEVGAGSENNNRCHKRDLVLTVLLYPG
jgi:hypothetical protein